MLAPEVTADDILVVLFLNGDSSSFLEEAVLFSKLTGEEVMLLGSDLYRLASSSQDLHIFLLFFVSRA